MNRDVQDAVDQITRNNANIRTTGDVVLRAERYGFSLDEFPVLQTLANVDVVITTAEQALRSARQGTEIQQAEQFTEITLPSFDVSGSACTYDIDILINNATVAVAGGTIRSGEPSFRSTLSGGNRNTLALAFFFASLDHDAALATKTVIIDDPVSSLDDHRSLATVQQMRRLGGQVDQLIVLSHNRSFLCELYTGIDPTLCTAISIVRGNSGSSLSIWDVSADRVSQHDIWHDLLLRYSTNGPRNLDSREVARSTRPHLEAFLRVSCPDTFPVGSMLGPFRGICEQRVGLQDQILSQHHIDELRDLTEYSNRYHHDTNPAWATETVNDAELRGYIGRVRAFIRR